RVDGPASRSLHLRLAQFGDVAQPPPPPAGWYRAPAPGRAPPNTLVIGLVLAVVVVILAVSVIAFSLAGSSTFFPLGFAPFLCVPFLFVIIFIIIALSTASERSNATLVQWRLPVPAEESSPPGTYRYPFHFQIPAHALPSYAGRHASVKYILSARLDVPLWLDTVWTTEIYVFYDRPSVRTFAQPVRFRSGGQGPEVYVELDGDRFFARELIGCRITLSRTENARIRRVYTRLLGGEWAKADGQQETTETYRTEVSVPMEQIRVGVPFTFEIPIPADVASSYRGAYSYYSYILQVGLDI